jgi:hypothetical protein
VVWARGAEQPITIGTMTGKNIETYAPLVDVLCGHPYAHDRKGLETLRFLDSDPSVDATVVVVGQAAEDSPGWSPSRLLLPRSAVIMGWLSRQLFTPNFPCPLPNDLGLRVPRAASIHPLEEPIHENYCQVLPFPSDPGGCRRAGGAGRVARHCGADFR